MDAYSGYDQIKMHQGDEDKTTFTTNRVIYCYKVMPFDLKKAEATFHRMVNEVLKELIGNTMEVYVNDMLVKSLDRSNHVKIWKKHSLSFENSVLSSTPRTVPSKYLLASYSGIWSLSGD